MNEDCIICGESGGFYIKQPPFRTGPYCSQHRWELNIFLLRKRDRMLESKFNEWVNEFQSEARSYFYCSDCGFEDDSCGCDHPNLKRKEIK